MSLETEADALSGLITRLHDDGWYWAGHAWICPSCAAKRVE